VATTISFQLGKPCMPSFSATVARFNGR